LVKQDEEDGVVAEASQAMKPRLLDDEGEEVVDDGLGEITGRSGPALVDGGRARLAAQGKTQAIGHSPTASCRPWPSSACGRPGVGGSTEVSGG
jgi:hypothetical protein